MLLDQYVADIQKERNSLEAVPGFDPKNGDAAAKYLLVMEAPGPKSIETGFISLDNPDPTAKNLKNQLRTAGVSRKEILLWNIVPWYLGNDDYSKIRKPSQSEIVEGNRYLVRLISMLDHLECVVLVGAEARKAHLVLSMEIAARILTCHHPSAQAMNSDPEREKQNLAVLRSMTHQPR